MPSKWNVYRVRGTVEVQYDDIMSDTPESAIDVCEFLTKEGGSFGPDKFKNFNLKAKCLRPATREEVVDGYGEKEWED